MYVIWIGLVFGVSNSKRLPSLVRTVVCSLRSGSSHSRLPPVPWTANGYNQIKLNCKLARFSKYTLKARHFTNVYTHSLESLSFSPSHACTWTRTHIPATHTHTHLSTKMHPHNPTVCLTVPSAPYPCPMISPNVKHLW